MLRFCVSDNYDIFQVVICSQARIDRSKMGTIVVYE